jgi:hypothetical protein
MFTDINSIMHQVARPARPYAPRGRQVSAAAATVAGPLAVSEIFCVGRSPLRCRPKLLAIMEPQWRYAPVPQIWQFAKVPGEMGGEKKELPTVTFCRCVARCTYVGRMYNRIY